MKYLRHLLIVIHSFISFQGYSQSGSTSRSWFDTTYFQLDSIRGWRTIDKLAYTIQIPTDWVYDSTNQEMGADIIAQTYQETSLDSFSENVTVLRFDIAENEPTDLLSYVETSFEPLQDLFQNFKEEVNTIEENEQVPFHKWMYTGSDGRHQMRIEQYTFIREQTVYIITLTTEAEKFYRYKAVGEKILNSFSFKK